MLKQPPKNQASQFKLNKANYYSNDANWHYQSATQFKGFMACEAAELAQLKGEWEPRRDPTALLVGNYLHSYFESPAAHQEFLDEHPEIIATTGKNRGQPKAPYQQADKMIDTLRNDETFNRLYRGEKEAIVTGTIGGVEWMGKLDCFGSGKFKDGTRFFLDIKTTQDIYKKRWVEDNGEYGSFIEAYRYPLQMAVYQELIRQQYKVEAVPLIVAVSKQDPPDKAIVSIPQDLLDYWLRRIKEEQPRIEAVKNGEVEPKRCGHCEYCRTTKKITEITELYKMEVS